MTTYVPDGGGYATGLGAGTALILAAIAILTVELWAGPTRVIDDVNYANTWSAQLTSVGAILVASGVSVWARLLLKGAGQTISPDSPPEPSHQVSLRAGLRG